MAAELPHHALGIHVLSPRKASFQGLCHIGHDRDVRLDLAKDFGPLNLHNHVCAVRQLGPVHLGCGRGGKWLRIDLREDLFRRRTELGLDDRPRLLIREGWHIALQLFHLPLPFLRQRLRLAGDDLPHFDVDRAKFLQHEPHFCWGCQIWVNAGNVVKLGLHPAPEFGQRAAVKCNIQPVAPNGLVDLLNAQIFKDTAAEVKPVKVIPTRAPSRRLDADWRCKAQQRFQEGRDRRDQRAAEKGWKQPIHDDSVWKEPVHDQQHDAVEHQEKDTHRADHEAACHGEDQGPHKGVE